MNWRRRAIAIAVALLATGALLLPLVMSIAYLLSHMPPPGPPKMMIYLAMGECVMSGAGFLNWFRVRIESRLK